MTCVRVRFEKGPVVTIELREGTGTAEALLKALPFASKAQTWGMEVYFSAPFHAKMESDSRAEMRVGEVAFWPDGEALAIFYGRTPASDSDQPKAVGPCNIVGTIMGDPSILESVVPGSSLVVELEQ